MLLNLRAICMERGSVTAQAWQENAEQWRPLKVIVPDSIASHSREQVAHFGPYGLLRRALTA
jgi:hypothetical protein